MPRYLRVFNTNLCLPHSGQCNRGVHQNLIADLLRPSLLGPTLTGYGVVLKNSQLYGKVCTDPITTRQGLGDVTIGSVKHLLNTIRSTNVCLLCYLTGYYVALHQALGISAINYFPTCTSPSVELAVLPGLGVPHRCSCQSSIRKPHPKYCMNSVSISQTHHQASLACETLFPCKLR